LFFSQIICLRLNVFLNQIVDADFCVVTHMVSFWESGARIGARTGGANL
jgi:hypothetical protein